MNSISRGWLFIILFGGAAVLLLAARGFGGAGDITGSVESETTNPGIPYAGTAEGPDGSDGSDDDRELPARFPRQGEGTLFAGRAQLLPVSGDTMVLSAYEGDEVTAQAVPVLSVDADEGFWIGSPGERLWVQLVGPPPESPYRVRAGDSVTFSGRIVEHSASFAARVGVDRAEGSRTLAVQRAHIEVSKRTLAVAP
ncbi:hypothetical protein [Kineosporia succinea]|uniref:Uncharacterized protein n=1 Tax=Kineosporia succinea TaxID=84632 RepID=A0ABT9P444_9ACTN|nr:hypothetical protein [Kineosporia succinea]MDP9827466.1 hypothetical protein [Kineosporia succinea]